MSDVGKMIHSCSDQQATAERPFQQHAPFPSEEAALCPAANTEGQMLHKNFFLDGDKHPSKCPELQMHQT